MCRTKDLQYSVYTVQTNTMHLLLHDTHKQCKSSHPCTHGVNKHDALAVAWHSWAVQKQPSVYTRCKQTRCTCCCMTLMSSAKAPIRIHTVQINIPFTCTHVVGAAWVAVSVVAHTFFELRQVEEMPRHSQDCELRQVEEMPRHSQDCELRQVEEMPRHSQDCELRQVEEILRHSQDCELRRVEEMPRHSQDCELSQVEEMPRHSRGRTVQEVMKWCAIRRSTRSDSSSSRNSGVNSKNRINTRSNRIAVAIVEVGQQK